MTVTEIRNLNLKACKDNKIVLLICGSQVGTPYRRRKNITASAICVSINVTGREDGIYLFPIAGEPKWAYTVLYTDGQWARQGGSSEWDSAGVGGAYTKIDQASRSDLLMYLDKPIKEDMITNILSGTLQVLEPV